MLYLLTRFYLVGGDLSPLATAFFVLIDIQLSVWLFWLMIRDYIE